MVAGLWALWPEASRAMAAAVLCTCLAIGCAAAALLRREPIKCAVLNRWFEVLILLMVAGLILVAA